MDSIVVWFLIGMMLGYITAFIYSYLRTYFREEIQVEDYRDEPGKRMDQ